jgi:hypothetical protein
MMGRKEDLLRQVLRNQLVLLSSVGAGSNAEAQATNALLEEPDEALPLASGFAVQLRGSQWILPHMLEG